MITTNVYMRVFQLRVGENLGTCFTIDVDEKQYIITARHLLEDWDSSDPIEIYRDGWRDLPVSLVGATPEPGDIAVLSARETLIPGYELEASSGHIIFGQDVYFVGFPFGFRMDEGASLNRGFPIPFLKKAVVSAMYAEDGIRKIFLDGINNEGFSGGPMVFAQPHTNVFKVGGVVCCYKTAFNPVLERDLKTETEYFYGHNTGIIECHSIEAALVLIRENPIGVPIPTTAGEPAS